MTTELEGKALLETLENNQKAKDLVRVENVTTDSLNTLFHNPTYQEALELDKAQQRNLKYFIDELGHNINAHGFRDIDTLKIPEDEKKSVLDIKQLDGNLYITTENFIEHKDEEKLVNNLEKINQMSLDDLNTSHENQITNGEFSKDNTAGL
jgi:hypothetical protein